MSNTEGTVPFLSPNGWFNPPLASQLPLSPPPAPARPPPKDSICDISGTVKKLSSEKPEIFK